MRLIEFRAKGLSGLTESVKKQFLGIYQKYSNLFINKQTLPLLFDTYRKSAIDAIRGRFPGLTAAHKIFRGFPSSDDFPAGDFITQKEGKLTRYIIKFRHKAEIDSGMSLSGLDKPIFHPFRKKAMGRGAYMEPINRVMLQVFDKGKRPFVIPSTGKKIGLITTLGPKSKSILRIQKKGENKPVYYPWKKLGRIHVRGMKGSNWRGIAFKAVLNEIDGIKQKIMASIARRKQ